MAIGPISRGVCCNVKFIDNLEIPTSLPDLCFDCVAFNPISDLQAVAGGDASLIPPNTTVDAPGVLILSNCQTPTGDGPDDELGADFEQFIISIHGQAVGQFGFASHGKFTGDAF